MMSEKNFLKSTNTSQSTVSLIRGFTLLELMVVILISAILFGAGYASYRNFSQRQALVRVAREIEAEVRQTQSKALSGQLTTGCGTLRGYTVTFNSTGYSTASSCSATPTSISSKSFSGYNISVSGTNPILFKVLGQGTNITTSQVAVTITNSSSGESVRVIITKSGDAYID